MKMQLLEGLKWRYATKKFDPAKKVSEDDLAKIKEAVRLSASSYGLQLYKVLIIEDEALREKLRPASMNQSQVTDASHLFVFCRYDDVHPEDVDAYVQLKAETQNVPIESISGFGDYIKKSMTTRKLADKENWMARQVYIALGNLLAACGELQIDACPMEGFVPDQYNEILGLKAKGLSATVLATVGYRSEEDGNKDMPKVRKSTESLFETI